MPIGVPFSAAPAAPAMPTLPPPDPTFLMMAAAQMHKQGRLVKPRPPAESDAEISQRLSEGKAGTEEWETAHPPRNPGENMFGNADDPKIGDVQQLFNNRIRTQVGDKPLASSI